MNSASPLPPDGAEPAFQDTQRPPENPQPAQPITSEEKSPAKAAPGQTATEKSQPTPEQSPGKPTSAPQEQPKRILGIMPNFRAVSPGQTPPPPTPKQAFRIATQNSFDYSSFAFVGITSLLAEGTNTHPQLGKGLPGFGRYYWRGFVDKTNGNYLVMFALPTLFRQDERYFAMGQGSVWKRATYSASRVLITPNYHGRNSFNISELLGRALAQVISTSYYPSQDRTGGALAKRFGFAVGRDALTNVFREFWPDLAVRVLHRHP